MRKSLQKTCIRAQKSQTCQCQLFTYASMVELKAFHQTLICNPYFQTLPRLQLPNLEMYCLNRNLRCTKHLCLRNLGKDCAHVLHESSRTTVHPAGILRSTANPLSSEPRLPHNVLWLAVLRRFVISAESMFVVSRCSVFPTFSVATKIGARRRAWWTFDNSLSSTNYSTCLTEYGSW